MESFVSKVQGKLAQRSIVSVWKDDAISFVFREIPTVVYVTSSKHGRRPVHYQAVLHFQAREEIEDVTFGTVREEWKEYESDEKAVNSITNAVFATTGLDAAKKLLLEVLVAKSLNPEVKGDTISLLGDSKSFNVHLERCYGSSKFYKGEISFRLAGKVVWSNARWRLDEDYELELAVGYALDYAGVTNGMLKEVAMRKFPSIPAEHAGCMGMVKEMLDRYGGPTEVISQIKDSLRAEIEPDVWSYGSLCGRIHSSMGSHAGWTYGKHSYEWAACKTVDMILGTSTVEAYERRTYGLIPKEQADKAAKWWADHLRGKNIRPDPLQVTIATRGLMEVMREELNDQPDTEARADRFERVMSDELQTKIANPHGVGMSVDHDPDDFLWGCWQRSDPDSEDDGFCRFPCKTRMRIFKDKIMVGSTMKREDSDKPI
jgi:hypothetical protein